MSVAYGIDVLPDNDSYIKLAEQMIQSGTAPLAKVLQTLSEAGATYYDEDTMKGTSVSFYAAGFNTTVTALFMFVLAVLANPDTQKKV
ncbi:hypothetical protein C8R44DRAFT_864628 [Mycena epipterygia]|nr:hypothetical protein C8R44DRAFT_864628 [Mycena epipterygia]